jgi:isopentenyl-diphosphate delta-isomerase
MPAKTIKRKLEHLKITTTQPVEYGSNWLEHVHLVHNALPQLDLRGIDTSTTFLGKKLAAPLMISGMTGGVPEAGKINKQLAGIAEELRIGFGVGSTRAAIEHPEVLDTFSVRKQAPKTLVLCNVGAVQLQEYKVAQVKKLVRDLGCDALAIHLNAAQEAAQPEGDVNFGRALQDIAAVAKEIPVMAKEVGNGIAREQAFQLRDAGCRAVDVGGLGGTSWIMVEKLRSKGHKPFHEWGIPTAAAVMECAPVLPTSATGGIRSGLEAAKAIALGASVAGMALPVLKALKEGGPGGAKTFLEGVIYDIRMAMFLTGSPNVRALRSANAVVTGPLKDWCDARGINSKAFAARRTHHHIA